MGDSSSECVIQKGKILYLFCIGRRCFAEKETPRIGQSETKSTEAEFQVERAPASLKQPRKGPGGAEGHPHVQ